MSRTNDITLDHVMIYAMTDTRFIFPRDPELYIWSASDLILLAAERVGNGKPATENEVANAIMSALGSGNLVPIVCTN